MSCQPRRNALGHYAEELFFQDELALFVLFTGLIGLIVLPPHCFLALPACNVSNNVLPRGHAALHRLGLGDVDNAVKQIRLAMLTAEVL